MSWSHYQTYVSAEAAKADVAALKEQGQEPNPQFGIPPAAKQMVLDAIELAGIAPGADERFIVGVKIEAGGHSGGGVGNAFVKVEPLTIKK